jgi:hypothetical protein
MKTIVQLALWAALGALIGLVLRPYPLAGAVVHVLTFVLALWCLIAALFKGKWKMALLWFALVILLFFGVKWGN